VFGKIAEVKPGLGDTIASMLMFARTTRNGIATVIYFAENI